VIAEDEQVLRDGLKHALIQLWPDLEICAEAQDGIQALQAVESRRPDALFLDIEMPGLTGLQVARQIDGRCRRKTPFRNQGGQYGSHLRTQHQIRRPGAMRRASSLVES